MASGGIRAPIAPTRQAACPPNGHSLGTTRRSSADDRSDRSNRVARRAHARASTFAAGHDASAREAIATPLLRSGQASRAHQSARAGLPDGTLANDGDPVRDEPATASDARSSIYCKAYEDPQQAATTGLDCHVSLPGCSGRRAERFWALRRCCSSRTAARARRSPVGVDARCATETNARCVACARRRLICRVGPAPCDAGAADQLL